MNAAELPDLLKRREVESLLRLSPATLRRAVAAGQVPAPLSFGKTSFRWRGSDIAALLKSPVPSEQVAQ